MRDVDITVDVLTALPLENVKARRRRQNDGRVQDVELGKRLVAFADIFTGDVFVFFRKRRIVLGTGEVDGLLLSLLELIDDRLKCRPVSFVVGKDDERYLLFTDLGLFAAGDPEFYLVVSGSRGEKDDAEYGKKHGEKHSTRTRIDVKT